MNIDAKDTMLGRVASYAAKQALNGENVVIFNCELAMISGKRYNIMERYHKKVERGDPFHGAFYPRVPREFFRRTIRGMLPYAQPRGREAYKRIKCFVGMPERFKNEKMEIVEKANIKKIKNIVCMSVKELCRSLK